jgi:uncharacterized protein (DUF2235 family)
MTSTVPTKNIVICCDGTGNQFGDHNSNVIRLFSMLRRESPEQILYYHPGVGTKESMEIPTYVGMIEQKIQKWHGFAYGYGLINNIAHAYNYLMANYNPGDKIYLMGFSRGAFTARALCALIYEFGLLEKGNDSLIAYMMGLFVDENALNFKMAQHFKATFGRECAVHFVGVWDTVSSVGWFYSPLSLPYTRENPGIKIGRQALAIDERRVFFQPNPWGPSCEGQDLKQVWFAGTHSDVGGGWPRRESGLANISLRWLLDEAEEAGLMIDAHAKEKLLTKNPPNPNDILHESLHGLWWFPEYMPQPYTERGKDHFHKKFGIHRGRHRFIPEGSLLHESVIQRMENPANHYKPVNLPSRYEISK